MKHGNSCPDCYHTQISINEDDNNQGEINVNHQHYNADDDDDISGCNTHLDSDNSEDRFNTQTVVSKLCNTIFKKFNQHKTSDNTCGEENESLPKIIGIQNSVTTTSVEPATLIDGNKNNAITDNETVEDNFYPVNEIITDKNLLEFVFNSIENLEVNLKDI